jgi:hypothetical protein
MQGAFTLSGSQVERGMICTKIESIDQPARALSSQYPAEYGVIIDIANYL